MNVEHIFPDEAVDGDVLVVEAIEVEPRTLRITYAIYEPPVRKQDDVDAERAFVLAADALYEEIENHFQPDPRCLPAYPPGSRLYLATTAYYRARSLYARNRA